MRKIHIITLGCKLNYFESEAIAGNLRSGGFEICDTPEDADTVVVNTCTVTNRADVKSRQAMRRAKREGKTVVATGCYAHTDGEALRSLEFVDLVVDNSRKFRLADILAEHTPDNAGDFPEVTGFERTRGVVKIQDGCDKFCSYCKIPHARGRSRSLDAQRVEAMTRRLIDSGYKEIVLTGVNISAYRYGDLSLAGLIARLLDISGDWRLRLSSLQPDEFEDELIRFLSHPRFTPHFHLSLQSGSDSVLKRMNRHYTAADFLDLTRRIRKTCPDCGLTTDIIVGFPGETEEEFGETLGLVRRVEFSRAHLFPYSPRTGTAAARLPDIRGDVKKEREHILQQAVVETAVKFTEREVLGREYRVLVEESANGVSSGYTPHYFRLSAKRELSENEFAVMRAGEIAVSSDGVVELKE